MANHKKPKNLRAIAVCITLPSWLIDKMLEKQESRSAQVEEALCLLNGWEKPQ